MKEEEKDNLLRLLQQNLPRAPEVPRDLYALGQQTEQMEHNGNGLPAPTTSENDNDEDMEYYDSDLDKSMQIDDANESNISIKPLFDVFNISTQTENKTPEIVKVVLGKRRHDILDDPCDVKPKKRKMEDSDDNVKCINPLIDYYHNSK